MLASEYIAKLQHLIRMHGDLELLEANSGDPLDDPEYDGGSSNMGAAFVTETV